MRIGREMMKGRPVWRPFFLGAAAALAAMSAPAQAAMRGYIVTSFDTIRVEAPVHVIVNTGGGASGSGEGERELLDRVDLSVSGGVLTVRLQDGNQIRSDKGKSAEPPVITISTTQIRKAQVLGGGTLRISEVDGLDVELSMSGNGELTVDKADVERLSLYVGGGGRLTVAGRARDVRASVNGPGVLEAGKLVAKNATIANDGIGSVHVSVEGPAKVVSTGSGGTVVDGHPVCTVTRRGTGAISCGS